MPFCHPMSIGARIDALRSYTLSDYSQFGLERFAKIIYFNQIKMKSSILIWPLEQQSNFEGSVTSQLVWNQANLTIKRKQWTQRKHSIEIPKNKTESKESTQILCTARNKPLLGLSLDSCKIAVVYIQPMF